MKMKLSLILTALILFTSCSRNSAPREISIDTSEKIFSWGAMTAGNQYLFYTGDLLRFVDLTSGDMTKHALCSKPNCKHDNDLCAAYMLRIVKKPFIYNKKFYYFMWYGNDLGIDNGLYQAETDGTNQKLIFKLEDNYGVEQVSLFNGNLIFTAFKDDFNDSWHRARSYRAYIYDFNKVSLFFESENKYDAVLGFYGIIGEHIYLRHQGRDYHVDIPADEFYKYINDKNSAYWQGLIYETRKMPLVQADPKNPVYEVIEADTGFGMYFLGDCYYFYANDENAVYRVNTTTNKSDIIFSHNINFYTLNLLDGKVFITTVDMNGENFSTQYYDGSKFIPVGKKGEGAPFQILFETEDYFFGFDIDFSDELIYRYILKTDYYNGNWDGLIEFEW